MKKNMMAFASANISSRRRKWLAGDWRRNFPYEAPGGCFFLGFRRAAVAAFHERIQGDEFQLGFTESPGHLCRLGNRIENNAVGALPL